jgi:hypothetical protein
MGTGRVNELINSIADPRCVLKAILQGVLGIKKLGD